MSQNVSPPDVDDTVVDPARFAASVRALLNEDPRRYRLFGAYWYFVKALLKRYYDRNEMPILGDYEDVSVNARIPRDEMASADVLLAAAVAEYRENAALNLGRNEVVDADGEFFTILDPDVEG